MFLQNEIKIVDLDQKFSRFNINVPSQSICSTIQFLLSLDVIVHALITDLHNHQSLYSEFDESYSHDIFSVVTLFNVIARHDAASLFGVWYIKAE